MLAIIPSATLSGVDGLPVTVEAHVGKGLPAFTVVGLPDASCREARDRIRAAFASSQFAFPDQRITVNLAPSGLRKAGAATDLAIAVALLVAAGDLAPEAVDGIGFLGELGLDGTIRRVDGAAPLLDAVDADPVVVPSGNAIEAQVIGRQQVRAAASFREVVGALRGDVEWPALPEVPPTDDEPAGPDLADVRGQPMARFALEIAAAGEHPLLLVGPPGSGKSMLASRIPSVLPSLDEAGARRVTCIHSAAGMRLPAAGLVVRPPFRAPHHSSSRVSLIGGGTQTMRPGEASLAHLGVLFLDELGEFDAGTLDAFRQPLEDGEIRVSRAHRSVVYPAEFLLVAASNPCPCGWDGPQGRCRCSPHARSRYLRRLSGPLLDRFDLRVTVGRPDTADLLGSEPGEASAAVRARVERVRAIARARGCGPNGALSTDQLDSIGPLSDGARRMLEGALDTGRLTGRGLVRVRRVARTIADLRDLGSLIEEPVVAAALALRGDPLGSDEVAA